MTLWNAFTSEKVIRPPGVNVHRVGSRSTTASDSLWPAISCQLQLNKKVHLLLCPHTYQDNPFELIRPNETVFVSIQILERLTKPFALQTFH